jgi:hypothetical protein
MLLICRIDAAGSPDALRKHHTGEPLITQLGYVNGGEVVLRQLHPNEVAMRTQHPEHAFSV